MNHTITVAKSFDRRFKQSSGATRLGVDWAIEISGEPSGMVVVRTYFSSKPPQDAEKKELADKAVLFVQRKLEKGWLPWPGIIEYEDDVQP